MYSLLLPSANDVANALAEHVAGSVKDFVLLMNERATTLGCSNTHFVNPSGLHNDDQYTTATDMAKILQYAMTFPMYMQVTSSVSYRHSPIKRFKDPDNSNNQVLNTNSILLPGSIYYYSNITSGKTGHTQLAGYNIASSAKKHGMHLICIILGSQTDKIRYTESKLLYDFYFDNYVSLNIVDIDPRFNNDLSAIAINDVSLIDTLNITCNQDAHITLPVNVDYNSITSKINYQVEDAYDRYAIGTIYYYLGDTFVGKCNIEGKNADTNDSIFTGNLDLSNRQLIDEVSINTKNIDKTSISHNSLVYINNSGEIIASNTLILFIVITIITTIVIALSIFIYTNVISNSNIPIQKVFFKLRRKFRK